MGYLGFLSLPWLDSKSVSRDRKWELPVLEAWVQRLAQDLFYRIHSSKSLEASQVQVERRRLPHLRKKRVKELGGYINYFSNC